MNPKETALILVDMQNDFLHEKGAYARGGATSEDIAQLKGRLAPLAQTMRKAGAWVVSTQFTLVPGKDGEPFISPHLKALRPFLGKGDFAPNSWGQSVIDELQPVDFVVEKVAYSAFYMSRLQWVLNRAGIKHLIFAGIVTNGGVASTARDAHVRDFHVTILSDGCAAFNPKTHADNIAALGTVGDIKTCQDIDDIFSSLS